MGRKELKHLTKRDYEFMSSLSAAMLEITPKKLRIMVMFWVVTIVALLIWSYYAQIDEIVRGTGEIIPGGKNQIVQNLEGGIVEEILIKEGENVQKDQILLKINNQRSESSLSSSAIKIDSLEARKTRLEAEANNKKLVIDATIKKRIPQIFANEESLYLSHKKELESKVNSLQERVKQREQELSEAKTQIADLEVSMSMINQEVRMTKPMVDKGVRSKVDFLKLQREENDIKSRFNSTKKSIPRLVAAINEAKSMIDETKLTFRNEAKIKLNEVTTELKSLKSENNTYQDQVTRTLVRSPMKGVVQNLFINTIGGVIKPGEDIVEIVPSDQTLIVEIKVKPSDIAFVYFGQKAMVKFSAYDFSIYGGLEGKVILISADTTKDEKDNSFYTVRIKTDKNFIRYMDKNLKIIPGMTVNVDIITGKKRVLDYIFKPILKTKEYVFTER